MVGLGIGSSSRAESDPSCSEPDPDPLNLSWAHCRLWLSSASPQTPLPRSGFVHGRKAVVKNSEQASDAQAEGAAPGSVAADVRPATATTAGRTTTRHSTG